MSSHKAKIDRQKGKSVLYRLNNYTVIDIETTGFDPYVNEIIELSALKVRDKIIVDKFSSLVKPNAPVDEFITKLTGITNENLENAPKIEDIISKYIEFIGDDTLLGHNTSFDINFIYDAYLKYCNKHFDNCYMDTLRISRRVLTGIDRYNLKYIAKYFNIPVEVEHRALADCETTYLCYEKLREYINSNHIKISETNNYKSADNIIEISLDDTKDIELNPFYNQVVVFTGTLENFSRNTAMQIIEKLQGINGKGVTKQTNYLILGNNDYCSAIKDKDGKSTKQKKAEDLILKGQDLKIISENVFYDMIADYIE